MADLEDSRDRHAGAGTRDLAASNCFQELRKIVAQLRGPDGCPWDREQTHRSIRNSLLEEAHEVIEAINIDDDANLCEELGDLLLQVVFHAQIATEQDRFTIEDVCRTIVEKLVRRHPHVFGTAHCPDSATVLKRWDEIKRVEKGSVDASLLSGISRALPSLMRAQQLQKRAARIGFDWPEALPVLNKLREEIAEVEQVLVEIDDTSWKATRLEEEIGDVLFSVVNLARKLKIDAEIALEGANEKFVSRFQQVERLAQERGVRLEQLDLAQMDALWEEVKDRGT